MASMRLTVLIGAVVSFLTLALWTSPTLANGGGGPPRTCGSHDEVLGHLKRKYGEEPAAYGAVNNGGLVELVKSKAKDTWTLIITLPSGSTCLMAAGEGWREIAPVVPTDGGI